MLGDAGRVLAAVALAGAAASALYLARPQRYPAHRPVALALTAAALTDAARALLSAAHGPLALSRALCLAFPALSAALALEVLALRWSGWARLGRAVVAAAYLVALVVMLRADWPRRSLEVELFFDRVQFAGTLAGLGALAAYLVRRRGRVADVTEQVVILLLAGDIAERVGPWMYGHPARDWDLARWQHAVIYLVGWYLHARRIAWWTKTLARPSAPGS